MHVRNLTNLHRRIMSKALGNFDLGKIDIYDPLIGTGKSQTCCLKARSSFTYAVEALGANLNRRLGDE